MTTTLDQNLEDLLAEYLAVCNRSLEENADIFWYRNAKKLNRKLWGDANFRTVVYGEDPDEILGEATIHFDADAMALSLLRPGDHDTAFTWKVPLTYLVDVVDRPAWYLANPLMLDLRWFQERFRAEAGSRLPDRPVLARSLMGIAVVIAFCLAIRLYQRSR
jgi:hypothetical protein